MVVTSEYLLLATPRTGSRALAKAVMTWDSTAIEIAAHHPKPDMVLKYWNGSKPFYTIIRDPAEQVLSWYYHVKDFTISPTQFAQTYSNGWLFGNVWGDEVRGKQARACGLNIYEETLGVPVQKFLYKDGLHSALETLGLLGKQAPVIGDSRVDRTLLTDDFRSVVYNRFPKDVDLFLSCSSI